MSISMGHRFISLIIPALLLLLFVVSCAYDVVEPPSLSLDEDVDKIGATPAEWGSDAFEPPQEGGAPVGSRPSDWSDDTTYDVEDEEEFKRAMGKAKNIYTPKETKIKLTIPYQYLSPEDDDPVTHRVPDLEDASSTDDSDITCDK